MTHQADSSTADSQRRRGRPRYQSDKMKYNDVKKQRRRGRARYQFDEYEDGNANEVGNDVEKREEESLQRGRPR